MNNKKGYTLIELTCVIAIIAIISLVIVPSITGYIDNTNKIVDRTNIKLIDRTTRISLLLNENLAFEGVDIALVDGDVKSSGTEANRIYIKNTLLKDLYEKLGTYIDNYLIHIKYKRYDESDIIICKYTSGYQEPPCHKNGEEISFDTVPSS